MEEELKKLFEKSLQHRAEHQCGGVPYEYGEMLSKLVFENKPQEMLEVGTAIGYTAACLIAGNPYAHLDTIDQDDSHLDSAKENWTELGIEKSITTYWGKAEGILRELKKEYDFIFFDGYVPQTKMLLEFERLLKKDGLLVTANLFLRDSNGGKYLRMLQQKNKWETSVFEDTAISRKLF